jgi:hydroxyacylglutathione hydrolase
MSIAGEKRVTRHREHKAKKTIAIIGGGVSGALIAYHLMQKRVQARIIVIESRPELGLGLAYATPSLRHLLNVPAGKISALPNEPNHFLDWLRATHDAGATEDTFAPRAIFGRYIQSLLAETKGIEQVQGTATYYRPSVSGAVLTLSDGAELRADLVVLATGNFEPSPLPGVGKAAFASGIYRHNAWLPDTFAGLEQNAPVTLIGTGLTAVDVLLRLRELGHRGTITAVSRHGVFPNRHEIYTPMPTAAIPEGTPATCVAYLRAFRAAIQSGAEWRAAIDSLRSATNSLWLALPLTEQQRFRRHLQRRWDVVRHRMAPRIADLIEAELAAGTLVVREGHLVSVDTAGEGAIVKIRSFGTTQELVSRRVINCTGPSMSYRHVDSPLLKSLFAQGLATTGPLGGGFNCSAHGAMIGADGCASRVLFNLGPGRLGTLLESIAVPEIRQQAFELAAILNEHIDATDKTVSLSVPLPSSAAAQTMVTVWPM